MRPVWDGCGAVLYLTKSLGDIAVSDTITQYSDRLRPDVTVGLRFRENEIAAEEPRGAEAPRSTWGRRRGT
jgi:hypothetical protein